LGFLFFLAAPRRAWVVAHPFFLLTPPQIPPPPWTKKNQHSELTLVPPMLGSSQHLLNRDHAATYYKGMPRCLPPPVEEDGGDEGPSLPLVLAGRRLRRHGDEFARLPGGYYQALGRVDDTMNLGGIKVSSAEIERCVLERVHAQGVSEAAAVGVPAAGGGPERLVLFLVVVVSQQEQQQQQLEQACQQAVREGLNPLFRVRRALLVPSLPRTASGKVVRRALRERAAAALRAGGEEEGGGGGGPRSRM
jgi:acetyl-CoA synthetase